jgi:hypothetical protein
MRTAWPRSAEVVDVLHLADEGKHDVLGRRCLGRVRGGRPGDEADGDGEEENPSGCRPVASHTRTGAPVRVRRPEGTNRLGPASLSKKGRGRSFAPGPPADEAQLPIQIGPVNVNGPSRPVAVPSVGHTSAVVVPAEKIFPVRAPPVG